MIGNNSDIQPDTLHADTQGQSEAIFGLSFLLGIKLMPRIRNWKDLTFHLPDEKMQIENLDELFTGKINWDLITQHIPDMLQIAISISRGKVAPSTILRRLNSSSRKSKLYFAFRELGRATRTTFLLEYISNIELRYKVQSATNISEAWNGFIQWVSFGGNKLRKQDRAGQTKLITYNHLVANLIVFYNTVHLTKSLSLFAEEGLKLDSKLINSISPYRPGNINRFGKYEITEPEENSLTNSILHSNIIDLTPLC